MGNKNDAAFPREWSKIKQKVYLVRDFTDELI
jgi:hypothetical protein